MYVIVLTVISSLVAVLLVVLGIQLFLTLRDARATMLRINGLIDVMEHTSLRFLVPLTNLHGFMNGVKSGVHVFETFVSYLKKNEDSDD
ncbi:MAG: hypothetical protein UX04_C0002G0069 [Microgenomates group bacterium GW2011_GWF2_45_18]|nr:MAG: hypothetical protein UW18_C0001G0028 [Microgenomates group bacterium GW2011_GWF1_44_10]KKU01926.1 MAG: hypothetical protein UX04_C0002G0069 [Microgenomates group bacterium GW2011_GWF2_45_18]